MKNRTQLNVVAIFTMLALCTPLLHAQSGVDGLLKEIQQFKDTRDKEVSSGFQALIGRLEVASQDPKEARALLKESEYNVDDPTDDSRPKRKRQAGDSNEEMPDPNSSIPPLKPLEALNLSLMKHCALVRAALSDSLLPESDRPKFRLSWINEMLPDYPNYLNEKIARTIASDSPICKHFGIGYKVSQSDIGKESLHTIPALYKHLVLEPQQQLIKPEVLATWDVYIQLRQTQIGGRPDFKFDTYPDLLFQKSQDAFRLKPSEENVRVQFLLVKTYPEHPKFAEMLKMVQANAMSLKPSTNATPKAN
jgi:hypothetical protein